MLSDSFVEILDLQEEWSSENTPAMQRRGELIRNTAPEYFRDHLAGNAKEHPGRYDFSVEGRDGTGRKTEIPWIRITSLPHSPSAQEGWYLVYLFHAKARGVYLSLTHGSTRLVNGEYVPRTDAELSSHVAWARGILRLNQQTSVPILSSIDLGSSKKLPKAYEKSSAAALWYERNSIPNDSTLFADASAMLKNLESLYSAQDLGRAPDSLPPELAEATQAIFNASNPVAGAFKGGQGFGLSAAERRSVELCAMATARRMLEQDGYSVIDVSSTKPYDFEAKKQGVVSIVEVKGTTSSLGSVLLTRNEVIAHREHYPNNFLIVVHSIELKRGRNPTASGGSAIQYNPWSIRDERLEPLSFKYDLPKEGADGSPDGT